MDVCGWNMSFGAACVSELTTDGGNSGSRWTAPIAWLTAWITVVATAAFLLILIGGMLLRLSGHPLRAGEELSSLCFVWACFGGAALAYRRRRHVRLGFLSDRLSPAGRRILSWAGELAVIGFLALVVVHSFELIERLGSARMAISGLPQWLAYLPAPLFCSFMLVFAVESLVRPSQSITVSTGEL